MLYRSRHRLRKILYLSFWLKFLETKLDSCKFLFIVTVYQLYFYTVSLIFQTFLTLSLTDMANRVKLSSAKEAEKYVLHMVSQMFSQTVFILILEDEIRKQPIHCTVYVWKRLGQNVGQTQGSPILRSCSLWYGCRHHYHHHHHRIDGVNRMTA